MSELLDRLKAKYPHYKVISEPDPDCLGCKGRGEKHIRPSQLFPSGHDAPCLCICLSGEGRAETEKVFRESARRILREEFPNSSALDGGVEHD